MKHARQSKLQLFMTLIITGLCAVPIAAQTTAFTYQSTLTDSGNPANGNYDFEFKLFDTATVGTGTQQGSTVTVSNVTVTNGIFTVTLDFGANVFDGTASFLEIGVRPAGSPNPHTILSPRQAITPVPYAIQTVNAQRLGGLAANRYVATDTNGNIGIGTATPSTRLEVVHPTSQLRFGPTAADNGGYLVSTNPSQAILAGGAKWDGANWIARDTAASITAHFNGMIQFVTNSNLTVGSPFNPTPRMHIDVNGNVGIGTTTPGFTLDVIGGVRSLLNVSTHFVAETTGGTNSWAKFIMKTPNRSWAIGTSRGFNGDQLYIADETAGQIRLFIDTTGMVSVPVLNIRGGADFSENFDVSEANNSKPGAAAKAVAPGLVVSIDQKNPGKLVVSRQAYDRSVAGIISGAGGVSPGLVMGQKDSIADGKYPVALSGRVWVYADATRGAIKSGDLLTTSATPGHAMKVKNYARAHGAIIGKAMTALKSGTGLVLVLVSLQ